MKKTLSITLLFLSFTALFSQTLPSTYSKKTIVAGLNYPVAFAWTPDGRYLVTQKGGGAYPAVNAFIKLYDASGAFISNFYDLTSLVDADFERGLLGIAVDPNFATNRFVYAYYTYRNSAKTDCRVRIVKFIENNNVGTNPVLIYDNPYPCSSPGNHFGGIIGFRPSQPNKLYILTGDLAYNQTNPTLNYANKLNNPYGKVLRINTDGSIPTDNPFYDDGNPLTGNDDRIWSYGLRNMFGLTFNPITDSMYVSENGLNAWDEFDIIHKGANYGWPTCEGNYLNGSTTSPCNNSAFINPIAEWGAPLPSVVGCLYYTGNLMPEFKNHILVGDNDYGILYDLKMGNAPYYNTVTSKTNFADLVTGTGGLTDIKQGVDECIYVMKGGYTTNGEIYKICPASVNTNLDLSKSTTTVGQNYPNPADAVSNIDFNVTKNSKVSIDLFDLTGRYIKQLYNNNDETVGKHTITLHDLNQIQQGTYFYKVDIISHDNELIYTTNKLLTIVR